MKFKIGDKVRLNVKGKQLLAGVEDETGCWGKIGEGYAIVIDTSYGFLVRFTKTYKGRESNFGGNGNEFFDLCEPVENDL